MHLITHTDTQQSVGLLWTRDRPVAERPLPDNTQHLQQTSMPSAGFCCCCCCCCLYFICTTTFSWLSWLCLFILTVQHTTQTSMPPAGFEPAIPAGERLQTHALDRSATGIGVTFFSAFITTGVRSGYVGDSYKHWALMYLFIYLFIYLLIMWLRLYSIKWLDDQW